MPRPELKVLPKIASARGGGWLVIDATGHKMHFTERVLAERVHRALTKQAKVMLRVHLKRESKAVARELRDLQIVAHDLDHELQRTASLGSALANARSRLGSTRGALGREMRALDTLRQQLAKGAKRKPSTRETPSKAARRRLARDGEAI